MNAILDNISLLLNSTVVYLLMLITFFLLGLTIGYSDNWDSMETLFSEYTFNFKYRNKYVFIILINSVLITILTLRNSRHQWSKNLTSWQMYCFCYWHTQC